MIFRMSKTKGTIWVNSSELKFWSILLFFNSLLFVPLYILSLDDSTFFPLFSGVESGNTYSYFKYVFYRANNDVFRLSADFVLVSMLVVFLVRRKVDPSANPRRNQVEAWLLGGFYLCLFFYQIYASSFIKIYDVKPMFYNDISVVKTGFMIVYQGLNLKVLIALLVFGLFVFGVVQGVKKMLFFGKGMRMTILSKMAMVAIALLVLVNFKYGANLSVNNGVQWQSLAISQNIFSSMEASTYLVKFSPEKIVSQQRDISPTELKIKPTLYFISIESYGKILLDHDSLKDHSVHILDEFERELKESNWSIASNYSISPVKGGMSWIAYSNLIYGLNFKNQGTYNALLNEKGLDGYNDLFGSLRKNGYKNYRLVPLFKSGKIVIPWKRYSEFYRVDEWVKYENLNYKGELYGFGPAVPDQYSLNFTQQVMDLHEGPKTLFFLTSGSHNPFITPEIEKDWRRLNETKRSPIDGANLLVSPTFDNYRTAVQYELDVLSEFITSTKDSNAIFVLFGDHQPPYLTRDTDGFETPMHIISKNKNFIEQFYSYGFTDGALPDSAGTIKHEGFKTMFLKEYYKTYAKDTSISNDLRYLPNGLPVKQW